MVSTLVSGLRDLGLSPGNPYNGQVSHLGTGRGGGGAAAMRRVEIPLLEIPQSTHLVVGHQGCSRLTRSDQKYCLLPLCMGC